MRTLLIATIFVASAASAQLPVGQVAGSVAGATTASSLEGAIDPSPAVRARDRVTRPVSPEHLPQPEVHLRAGASARVTEGTRCHYDGRDGYYYDPVEREGLWYCEQTGPAIAVEAERR